MSESNLEGRDFWNRRAGAWDRRADFTNSFSDIYGLPAIDALGPAPGWRVLDIGSGPGATTLELARRVLPDGDVIGADISDAMVAVARRRAEATSLTNVSFVVADAETDPLGDGFDGVFSRFGVMFFSDPVAAFSNIGRSLRPGGRLAVTVWSALGDNPWMFVPTLAASGVLGAELTLPSADQPGPFSLADAARIDTVLGAGGFDEIKVQPIAGARRIPEANADEDVETLLEIGPMGDAYEAADDRTRRAAVDAVIAAIDAYREGDGWTLPGAALVLTATRR